MGAALRLRKVSISSIYWALITLIDVSLWLIDTTSQFMDRDAHVIAFSAFARAHAPLPEFPALPPAVVPLLYRCCTAVVPLLYRCCTAVVPLLYRCCTAVVPLLYAKTLQERTYEHQHQVISGGKPITLGHGYSTITWVPQAQLPCVLPLLHKRITSLDTPIGKAATQLRQVYAQISGKVLFLGDGEYGSTPFLKKTSDIPCNKPIRLRPNRVLYHVPGAYQGKGRPKKHGEKFSLKDRDTWTVAQEDISTQDDKLGRLRVHRWKAFTSSKQQGIPLTSFSWNVWMRLSPIQSS
jgi:DDE superfamily endonuclease